MPADLGPSVRPGIPRNPERHVQHTFEDVTIYVPVGFTIPRPITIGLTNYIVFKFLEIENWKLV